jgi:hypothetical protein
MAGSSSFILTLTARMAFVATLVFVLALPAARADNAAQVSMPLNLQTEQGSDFFTFFNLEPVGAPISAAGSQTWHSFRPSGAAFRKLVELDVLTAADGTIVAAYLGLDRSFIDDPGNGIFARDIAKSFLTWTVRKPSPEIGNLIANLANPAASGTVVIMSGPAPAPPPPDTTGGYAVYLGHGQRAAFADGGVTFAFTNFPGALPTERAFEAAAGQPGSGWLRIDVGYGK